MSSLHEAIERLRTEVRAGRFVGSLLHAEDVLAAYDAERGGDAGDKKYVHAIREHIAAPASKQPTTDKFVATFRCESNGIVGTTNAPIHSVSMHDDGVIEVVIDHWPEQPAAVVVDEAFRDSFFKKLRCLADYDPADESVGIMGDCWHAGTKDLEAAIDAALTNAKPED